MLIFEIFGRLPAACGGFRACSVLAVSVGIGSGSLGKMASKIRRVWKALPQPFRLSFSQIMAQGGHTYCAICPGSVPGSVVIHAAAVLPGCYLYTIPAAVLPVLSCVLRVYSLHFYDSLRLRLFDLIAGKRKPTFPAFSCSRLPGHGSTLHSPSWWLRDHSFALWSSLSPHISHT